MLIYVNAYVNLCHRKKIQIIFFKFMLILWYIMLKIER